MDFKTNSLSSQIQSLLDNQVDFQQKLWQHLVFKSDQVTNPFKFIGRLLSNGALCDGPNDTAGDSRLKELMVRLATRIAISKGADGICGLMDALEESGNLQLISDCRSWVAQNFGFETESDFGDINGNEISVPIPKSKALAKPRGNGIKTSSYGTKLIDKIMSRMEDDFMEQLQGHLASKAPEIVNVPQLCSSLIHQKVLDNNDAQLVRTRTILKSGQEYQQGQEIQKVMTAACSTKAIGSLVFALQRSNNKRVLADTYEWLETSTAKTKKSSVADESLACQQSNKESKVIKCKFFEQAALPDEISEVAVFNCQPKSATKGTIGVQFDKERMMACSADGTLNLWNWQDSAEEPINIAVKNITCFQYDEEILVLGTAAGTVHLFDMATFKEKWSVRLGEPVHSLKFLESTVVALTQVDDRYNSWWIEVSRADMRLLNQRSWNSWTSDESQVPGFCMSPDTSFVYFSKLAYAYDTKSGYAMRDDKKKACFLTAPDSISALNVGELVSSKRVVVAGCVNGMIAKWNTLKLVHNHSPVRTYQGHMEAIVCLCFLNGHLLSLDKKGKLVMWSGHDLESCSKPVPRVLIETSSFTHLSAHERWFVSSSGKDDAINIWTLPDLWLRTG